MERLAQLLVDGLTLGAIYALIALGFSLVWAAIRNINFAHGEVYMLGAFGALVTARAMSGANPALLLAAVIVVGAAVGTVGGAAIERIAFRPLRNAPDVVPVIATLGIGIALSNGVRIVSGSGFNRFPEQIYTTRQVLGPVRVSLMQVLVISLALLLMGGLAYFLLRTSAGMRLRAMAMDIEMTTLMGVNVNRTILLTFAVAGALGGIAGSMVAVYYGVVTFSMGFLAGVKGYTVAVLGGIGNMAGAVVGGLVLGVTESMAAGLISSRWKDVIALGLLITMIIVRPDGLLGRRLPEKL